MRVNGWPLTALVYAVCELDGHLGGAMPERTLVPLANGAGVFGTEVRVGARAVRVGLDVRPPTLVDRTLFVDALTRRLSGLLEITTDDAPGRVMRAECKSIVPEWYTGQYAIPAVYLQLEFVAVDPARWDVQPLTYGLGTARTSCPVGTATSAPVVEIWGPCSSPAIIVRAHTGAEMHRMEFAVALAAADALVVDSAQASIARFVAGVLQTGAASGDGTLTGGRFPILSPEHGAPDGSAPPTLELTAASGTPTGLVTYTRRW